METVLNDDYSQIIRPTIPPKSHPIDTGRYLISTSEIIRVSLEVIEWIDDRATGGIIYGPPRIGKSKMIDFLMHALPLHFGENLPVYHIPSLHCKLPNEGVFYDTLLKYVGHGIPHAGSPTAKRNRLFYYLLEKGEMSEQNHVILLVDEAQCLFELQYGWLIDIYNFLDIYHITLTVILVGQTQLFEQRSIFLETGAKQIVGRFMVNKFNFKGVETKQDLKKCLSGFDYDVEFPANSGWSYTRFFFPEAFEHGKRLENCADELFDAFKTIRQEAKLPSKFEIPMQYVIRTIKRALLDFGAEGKNNLWISKNDWMVCVKRSKYVESEKLDEIS